MARAKALPLVLVALLASAPLVEAAQEYLTPTWSRTLGKGGRWLAAEEDGRCFVIAERGGSWCSRRRAKRRGGGTIRRSIA